jgi:predicted NBD/HSP70 family sugar kinase
MFQRRPRSFRHRSAGRGHQRHANGGGHMRITPNAFSNNERRNNFRSTQSAEKLLEKYNALAKEALSSGDRILSENYFQHAEHFSRIIDGKNQNRVQISSTPKESSNNLVKNTNSVQEQEKQEQEKKE